MRSDIFYTGEERGVIKLGYSNTPDDTLPAHIVIEGLDVRSGRAPYTFTDDHGEQASYTDNAAAIYVEKAEHVVIRDCVMRDSGNGLFIGVFEGQTQNILIDGNHIYDNGIEDSIYQHNSYTSALGITFQHNHYGPLRAGCLGNNPKDCSAGLVVRYNWIESGNRQLDLVDGEDHPATVNHPDYGRTFVYGNVLIEPDGAGNSQMVHYGGDSGTESDYRKGTLYFYNNTVISTRGGNTTLLRLSTNEERADVRKNLVYVTESGDRLAMLSSRGTLDLSHNWFKEGWRESHDSFEGTITDDGTSVLGGAPGFVDEGAEDFRLVAGSAPVDAGTDLHAEALAAHPVVSHYLKHLGSEPRPVSGALDIGAFELCEDGVCEPWEDTTTASDTSTGTDTVGVSDVGTGGDAGGGDVSGDGGSEDSCGCQVAVSPRGGPWGGLGLGFLAAMGLVWGRRRR